MKNNLNKGDVVNKLVEATEISKGTVEKVLNSLLETLTKTLADGSSATFIGFGTFSIKERAARAGKNPQTGETIEIKECKVPSFKAGKTLRDAVN